MIYTDKTYCMNTSFNTHSALTVLINTWITIPL